MALIIVGISLFSISELSESLEGMGRQSKRAVDLNVIAKTALERRILTTSIIQTTDEAEMKKLIDNDMAALDKRMDEQIEAYRSHYPQPLTSEQQGYVDSIRKYWKDYSGITSEVAALSYENSNNKALVINEGMVPFWDEVDNELERLAVHIQDNSKDFVTYTPKSREVRNLLLRFRLAVVKYIPEEDTARMDAYEKIHH